MGFEIWKIEESAQELSNLYQNRKLNTPAITINTKKLRNPSDKELLNWIERKL